MAQEAPAQAVEMFGEQYDDFLSLLPLDLVQMNVVLNEIQNNNPDTRKALTENPYPCRICTKSFRHFASLQCHRRTHTAYQQENCEESENYAERSTVFACTSCDLVFKNKRNLQSHRKVHKDGVCFRCKECGKTFDRFKLLEFHLRLHKDKMLFICSNSTPSALSASETSSQIQLKENKNNTSFICTECGEYFISYKGVLKHQKSHTAFKLVRDDDSGTLGAEHSINLETQMTTPSLACTWCGDVFVQKGDLQAHQEMHVGDTSFSQTEHLVSRQSVPKGEGHHETLQECGEHCIETEPLVSDQSLSQGLKHQEESSTLTKCEPSFSCNHCNKNFENKVNLLTHQKIHPDHKPFACEECGNGFIQKGYLLYHQRINCDEKIQRKRYTCYECGKSLSKNIRLKKHQEMHLRHRLNVCTEQGKEKTPYNSTDCDQSCTVRVELQTHQQKHVEEKNFTCSGCGRKFNYRKGFLIHQRACTGPLCGQSSIELEKLQELLKEGHFSCCGCGRKFTYKKNFLKHLKVYLRNGLYMCAEQRTEAESFTHKESDQSSTDKMDIGHYHEKHEEEHCTCKGCGQTFTYRDRFLKHQEAYFRDGLYLCAKCRIENGPLTENECDQRFADLEKKQENQDGQNCTCMECGIKFTCQESFQTHKDAYSREGLYLCAKNRKENEPVIDSECDQRITDLEKPQEKQEEKNCTCMGCGRQFVYQKSYLKHQKFYFRDGLYLCTKNRMENEPLIDNKCDQRFPDFEKLAEGQNCTCRGCGRKFTYQKSFLKHLKAYLRKGLYICAEHKTEAESFTHTVSGQSSTDKMDIGHYENHEEEQHCACKGCGQTFAYRESFLKHQKAYFGEGLYLCAKNRMENGLERECDQRFTDLEKTQEKQDEQNCTCMGCGIRFICEKSFQNHKETFFKEGLYLCDKNRKENEPLIDSECDQRLTDLEKPQEKQEQQNCTCMGCGRQFIYQKSYFKHQKCYFSDGLYLCTKNRMEKEPLIDKESNNRFPDFEKVAEGQNCICHGCGRKFTYQKSFLMHLKAYLRKGLYMCAEHKTEAESFTRKESGQSSTDQMDIGQHPEHHEPEAYLREGFYSCAKNGKENEPLLDSECDQRFTDLEKPQEMQEHQKCFTCRGCERKFINQKKFQKHQKCYLRNSVYLCSKNRVENEPLTDGDLGQSVTNLEKQQEKQDGQNCTCMGCGRKFTYQKSYLKHQEFYFRDGLYLCTKNRIENEPLIDNECDPRSTDFEKLQEQQADGQNCTCGGCGRKFTYQKNFLKHQKSYTRKGLYLCTKGKLTCD